MKILKSLSVITLFTLVACNAGSSQNVLDVDKFEAKLNSASNAQVVDVRSADEFDGGHLANATNINVDDASFTDKISKLDKSKPTFVYCLAGGRSATAVKKMKDLGFKELYDMKGGFRAWSGAGKPVDTGNGVAAPVEKKITGMTKADLEKLLTGKRYAIVDFSAKWCGPCKVLAPVLDKIGKEMGDQVFIIKIDTDENPIVSDEFGIESLPTIMYFNGSKVIGKTLGWRGEPALRADVESFNKLAK
jgi:thioredoxin 1